MIHLHRRRVNPPLPTPAAWSFSPFSHSPWRSVRALEAIVSSACLPPQIINRRDLCRFLESGRSEKIKQEIEWRGRATRSSYYGNSFFLSHSSSSLFVFFFATTKTAREKERENKKGRKSTARSRARSLAGYRGKPINQVRASAYEMNIGREHLNASQRNAKTFRWSFSLGYLPTDAAGSDHTPISALFRDARRNKLRGLSPCRLKRRRSEPYGGVSLPMPILRCRDRLRGSSNVSKRISRLDRASSIRRAISKDTKYVQRL